MGFYSNNFTCCVRVDQETRDGVDEAKNEMRQGKISDISHGLAQRWPHDTIAHAHDEQQEEGKGVPESVKNGNNDQENLGPNIGAIAVEVVYAGQSSVSVFGGRFISP
jgi:hypothetical protein